MKAIRLSKSYFIYLLVLAASLTNPILQVYSQNPPAGRNYYVDATLGNDANNGISEAGAWKTLDRIRRTVYGAGDKILLKCGEVWNTQNLIIGNTLGQAAALSNGSANDFIEINSYGTGDNPRVYMLSLNRIGFVKVRNMNVTKRIVDSEYPVKVQHCNNISIEDCSFPGMYTDYTSVMTIRNVVSSNNAMEHGLYLCHESRSVTVEDCVFANNRGSGIQTNGSGMDSIIIHGCLIYGNGNLQNGGSGFNDVNSYNVTLTNNVFINGFGKAVESMNAHGKKYYNNVFISRKDGSPAVGMSNVDGSIIFKNNIFYVQSDAISGVNNSISSDYNCFYSVKSHGAATINWATTFANWVNQTGNDVHSLVTDPKLINVDFNTDPSTWDLHLKDSSLLVDKGVDVGLTFHGQAPDIGAFESDSSDQPPVTGITYYVSKTGNDANSGLLGSPWLTIQKAADIAEAGDNVLIGAGIYQELVTIHNSGAAGKFITFKKENASDNVVIDGQLNGGWFGVVSIYGQDYIRLDGLEIQNNTIGWGLLIQHADGNRANEATNIEAVNLKIHHVASEGIQVRGGANNIVIDSCEVYNPTVINNTVRSGIDVYQWGGGRPGNVTVKNCRVYNFTGASSGVGGCIASEQADNLIIENNECYGSKIGIDIGSGDNNIIRNNIVRNCDTGIALSSNENSRVYDNTIHDIVDEAVYCYYWSANSEAHARNKWYGNVVYNAGRAVYESNQKGNSGDVGLSTDQEYFSNIFYNIGTNNGYRTQFYFKGTTNLKFYNNTIYLNSGYSAIELTGLATGADVKNNIICVSGSGFPFTAGSLLQTGFTADYNCYYNISGSIIQNVSLPGVHSLKNVDPLFVNPASFNFNLQTMSQCIDAGTDVGLPFTGTAPDMGFINDIELTVDTIPPSVPQNLLAAVIGTTQINLTWNASTDNVKVTGYKVFRNDVQIATTINTTYSDVGLAPATNYSYHVVAVDSGQNVSGASVTVSATTVNIPFYTLSVNADHGSVNKSPDAATYSEGSNVTLTAIPNLGYTFGHWGGDFTGSTNPVTVNMNGNKTISAYFDPVPVDSIAPSVPSNLTGNAVSSTRIYLQWSASTDNFGVTGYKIFRNNNQIATSTVLTFSDSGLVSLTDYIYSVSAYDKAGNESAKSTIITIKTPDASADPVWKSPLSIVRACNSETAGNLIDKNPASIWHHWVTEAHWVILDMGKSYTVDKIRQYHRQQWDTEFAISEIYVSDNTTDWGTSLGNLGKIYNQTPGWKETDIINKQGRYIKLVSEVSYTSYWREIEAFVLPAVQINDVTSPSVPQNLIASAVSTTQINLSWSASTDNVAVTGYKIFRNNNLIANVPVTSFSDIGLLPSTEYRYSILAFDQAGNESAKSTNVTITTPDVSADPVWQSPVSIVSACNSETVGRLIDHNLTVPWHHWVTEAHWVILDMGNSYTIDKIRQYHARKWNVEYAFAEIFVSDNTTNWGISLGSLGRLETQAPGWFETDITDKQGRYIKLVSEISYTPYWKEVEACVLPVTAMPLKSEKFDKADTKEIDAGLRDILTIYPNPFDQTTTIEFQLPEDSNIKLEIFDLMGKKVSTILDEKRWSGIQNIQWHASGYAGGQYYCKLSTPKGVSIKKLILLK